MKKIIFYAIIVLLTTSCEVSDFGEPQRTLKAKRMSQSVFMDIMHRSQFLTMVNWLDDWRIAADDSTRYKIEDDFFSDYKLRDFNDSIQMITIYPNRDIMVYTHGKSINDPMVEWSVVLGADTITIKCVDSNSWSFSSGVEGINNTYCQLNFDRTYKNESSQIFRVRGKGLSLNITEDYWYDNNSNIITDNSYVSYFTERDLTVEIANNNYFTIESYNSYYGYDNGSNNKYYKGGSICLESGSEITGSDLATISILDYHSCMVEYRGFSELWRDIYTSWL